MNMCHRRWEHGAAVLVVDDRYVIGSRSGPVILTEHMKVDVHELIRDRNICVVTVRYQKSAFGALGSFSLIIRQNG